MPATPEDWVDAAKAFEEFVYAADLGSLRWSELSQVGQDAWRQVFRGTASAAQSRLTAEATLLAEADKVAAEAAAVARADFLSRRRSLEGLRLDVTVSLMCGAELQATASGSLPVEDGTDTRPWTHNRHSLFREASRRMLLRSPIL